MSVPYIRNLWKPAAIAAAISFLYLPVLLKLGNDWWTDENYSHGLLVPFIIGFMLWTERERLQIAARASLPSLWLGGVSLILALLALWAGTAGAELYIQRMSLVLLLAGIVIYFWGARLLRLTIVSFVLLVLAIPIPAIIFNQIAFPLQLFASRCAVWAMRVFEIPVLRQGNVIELLPLGARETKKLEVVEACSGIRSLMTLVTLAVVFAYFTRPKSNSDAGGGEPRGRFHFLKRWSFWRSLVIVLSAIPIAILTNAARVSGTGILAHFYGLDVADGFFHSFSGWVVYVVAFLLLFAVGWILDRFGGRGRGDDGGAPAAETVKEEKSKAVVQSAATMPVKTVSIKGAE
ncbi:MAG TPA: exosortase/archaeosortase family protein [Pyrinomonadaceae bacterium]|jgi:exosortase|nr:exosortase/archaeosortase family protein [Pyrinomonadaceae bacterium]